MMRNSFWENFKKPIIGLAPMDGVTDAVFRAITDKISDPDICFTEFVPVEALARGITKMMPAFITDPFGCPTIAQIFGTELDSFYQSTLLVCELGFVGVDINMGCPAVSIASRGAGAGLILDFDRARNIISIVRKATLDFSQGQTLEKAGVHPDIISYCGEIKKLSMELAKRSDEVFHDVRSQISTSADPTPLAVSVKTRIGYDKPITTEWIQNLLSAYPDNITLHGRTLKQLYRGSSDLEEISRAAEEIKLFNATSNHQVTLLGSGDASDRIDAIAKSTLCHTDGWLIGRASNGNPWIFGETLPTKSDQIKVALIHARLFSQTFPERDFRAMRKHLCWYMRGFEGVSDLRTKLAQVNNLDDVNSILTSDSI